MTKMAKRCEKTKTVRLFGKDKEVGAVIDFGNVGSHQGLWNTPWECVFPHIDTGFGSG